MKISVFLGIIVQEFMQRKIDDFKFSSFLCFTWNKGSLRSTNQADPSCFYFRISWLFMERRCCCFHPLYFVQGLRSLDHWLLQKLSMKTFDQKFKFLIKNRYFGALIFQEHELTSWPPKIVIFKILFDATIVLNLMIKKRPLTFSKLKKQF